MKFLSLRNIYLSVALIVSLFGTHVKAVELAPLLGGLGSGAGFLALGTALTVIGRYNEYNFFRQYNSTWLNTNSYDATNETCVIEWSDPEGDSGEDEYPCTGYARGEYNVFVNGTTQTLMGVVGEMCGDSTIDVVKAARKEFPQGGSQKIWYEIADPTQFVFDDAKPSWKYAVFGGTALVIGAVATTVSAIVLVKAKCPNLFKRAQYAKLTGSVEMETAR